MFLKLDKRLKDNYDVLNKSINYQQSMLGDRIKNLSVFTEEKLKDMEDIVNGTKRQLMSENQRTLNIERQHSKEIEELKQR